MTGDALSEQYPATSRRSRIIAVVGVMALLAIPASTLAAKGGGSTTVTPWIALATAGGGALAAAEPRLGSSVKFASGYSTNTKNPWVSLTCYQDGNVVYGQGGKPSADFSLGGASSVWLEVGGAATCRAELGDLYWKGGRQYYTYLAHTNFDAGG